VIVHDSATQDADRAVHLVVAYADTAAGGDRPNPFAHGDRGVAERISKAAESKGKKIEQAVTEVVKKFVDSGRANDSERRSRTWQQEPAKNWSVCVKTSGASSG
jgi:hypothetical protein